MGTDNIQFRRGFFVWRRKVRERSFTFSIRSMEIRLSSCVDPRPQVEALVEGNAWTPNQEFSSKIRAESSGGRGFRASGSSEGFIFSSRGRKPSYSDLFSI